MQVKYEFSFLFYVNDPGKDLNSERDPNINSGHPDFLKKKKIVSMNTVETEFRLDK